MATAEIACECVKYVITKPSFVAEDGFAFFKQAYEEPFRRIVFRPQAGYIQLAQRFIAELASFAPLEFIPLVYTLTALFVAAAKFTFFALPSFRPIVRGDTLRAVIVLALPFMPNANNLMRMCAVHWYLLFFLVLVTMMPLPKGALAAGSLWLVAALSFWSQLVAVVCVPVLVYRVWSAASGRDRGWWIALTAVAVIYPLTVQSGSALPALRTRPACCSRWCMRFAFACFAFSAWGKVFPGWSWPTAGRSPCVPCPTFL